jgi:hypothetical protein
MSSSAIFQKVIEENPQNVYRAIPLLIPSKFWQAI